MTPRHDIERAILGEVLWRGAEAIRELPENFASELSSVRLRTAFQSAHRLYSRNLPVDLASVKADLEQRGELETAGGVVFLAGLVNGERLNGNLLARIALLREFPEPGEDESPMFPQTDAGSGELIADLYGDRLRYDHRRGRWLVWSGHHWRTDCEAAIRIMAIEAARWRYRRAQSIFNLKAREAEAKYAIWSESRDKVQSALFFAQAIEPIADRGDDWDRHSHLLGCDNGIVDLKTGTLRPGCPEDRITMTTGIDFDPEAKAPRWDRFLMEIFNDNEELIDWILRAVGHSATGDTSEQIVCVVHGDGCNGKSVFCSTLRHVLGDYAYNMPFSTIERNTRPSIPNDLAALISRRFVFASETNESTRLNESRIKALTGGDPITARFLHQEFFEFMPILKPWLSVNHLPAVGDLSYGFWRRVRLIPFTRQFKGDQADKHLADTLKTEAPGILAWIVAGAVAWYERGLDPVPDVVKAATDEYERSSDELGEYVAERLVVQDGCTVKAADFFKDYSAWADDRGLKKVDRLTATAFGRRMRKRFRKTSDRHGTTYHGVGLVAPEQDGGVVSRPTTSTLMRSAGCLREDNVENPPQPTTLDGLPARYDR